jgi:ATP-dependent Lhr-like helicase
MTGLTSEVHDLGVTIPKTTIDESVALLRQLSELSALSAPDVAAFVRNIRVGKFAEFVPADVACTQWAEQNADLVKQVPAMAEVALQQSRL